MKKVCSSLVVLFALVNSVFSQAKVGTTGAQFLDLSPSVQAIGMGEASAATTTHSAFYNNPAILGLSGLERKVNFSFFPVKADFTADVTLQNFYLSVPLSHSIRYERIQGVTFGLYQTRLKVDGIPERTYERLESGRTFSYNSKATNLVFGYAYQSNIQFAAGVSFKHIRESSLSFVSNGFAVDVGLFLKHPNILPAYESTSAYELFMAPSVGFALRNYGPDIEVNSSFIYKLPSSSVVGFGYELGLRKIDHSGLTLEALRILFAMDIEYLYDDFNQTDLGMDFSFFEILNFRLGRIDFNRGSERIKTTGFTLSTERIGKFVLMTDSQKGTSRFLEFITERFNLEYNYAKKSGDFIADVTYHEIVLSYQL